MAALIPPTDVRRILDDPDEFITRLFIRTKKRKYQRFYPLWDETKEWATKLIHSKKRFFYGLKPRAVAFTTYTVGYEFWAGYTSPDAHLCLQVAHEDAAIVKLKEIVDVMYHGLPSVMQRGLEYQNKFRTRFKPNSSGFDRLLAGGKGQARAQVYSSAHFTEGAFYRRGTSASTDDGGGDAAENVWSAVDSALNEESRTYFETTGNGPFGLAYKLWKQARNDPEWEYVFVRWSDCQRYQKPVDDPHAFMESLDSEEKVLAGEPWYLTPQQLAWRREKIRTKKWTSARFRREYPLADIDPFLAAVQGWFDQEKLVTQLGFCRHPLARDQTVPLREFHPPERGRTYFLGFDPSGGTGNDDAYLHVLRDDLLNVACWRSNLVGAQGQADIIAKTGARYGGDWGRPPRAVVECNNRHGRGVLHRLRQMGAGMGVDLYVDPRTHGDYYASRETKTELFTFAREVLEDIGRTICEDAFTLIQAQAIVEKANGKIEAKVEDAIELEEKDDGISAYAMALLAAREYLEHGRHEDDARESMERERARVGQVVQHRFGGR